ncbi:MAG: class I SAM-dependent methyltransferase [Myxococcales bacterium]
MPLQSTFPTSNLERAGIPAHSFPPASPPSASERAQTAWVDQQRRVYARRYAHFRAVHDFLRYDARYRLFLMEELFRRHDIPFERQRVFELGFGTGSLLMRFDTSSSLHGSEISESAVNALRDDPRLASYAEADFRVASSDGNSSFPSSDYDIVIASHVIEHVPDDLHTLTQLAQHTRAGGYGLFFLPLERPRHNPDHARTYTAAGFSRLLSAAGFTPIHISENFRYASHLVQVINWPSRARIPLLGPVVEAIKSLALALPPTSLVRLVEEPLARLHVAPYQLMVLAQKREPANCGPRNQANDVNRPAA